MNHIPAKAARLMRVSSCARTDAGEIDKSVNRAQEMILGYERIEIELVEESALRHLPRSHHRQILPDLAN